ncbi:hypothetical protein AYL99_06424 [Fonsecaea erecta]|uniref:IBR domain-containing protein n=1 Tax=Fonsecaea erecta TaxID=1367422 RepID=A0A178ZI50_9EURO|nr:hypothetical protein AYL99_06424 [Fonsecaea erecta]OAP59126.1 hypothetical protein AYL99_06424 [Fonsecaea erecta]
MAGQGSSYIAMHGPSIPSHEARIPFTPPFAHMEGYLGLRTIRQGRDGIYYWVFGFSTAAGASSALHHHPHLYIAGRQYDLFSYEGVVTAFEPRPPQPPQPSDISPPRKRLKKSSPASKVACKICFDDIEGAYSTPCRQCAEPVCYECLKSLFKTAMRNIDRMPVMCCATVMHHDVTRGILPAAEVEKYKQKYDESSTINPLYCPVPTCSAFLPPRTFKPTDKRVTCHVCATAICIECRQHAEDKHVCTNDDSRRFILQAYEYKTCPKCGTGVMKIQEGEESDGGEFESESDEEEDGNIASAPGAASTEVPDRTLVQAPQDQILLDSTIDTPEQNHDTTPTAQVAPIESAEVEIVQASENETQTQAPEAAELSSDPTEPEEPANGQLENLDDPDDIDWEGVSMDFGDEPTDETWDTWGCRHLFSEFSKARVPEFWLAAMNPAEERDLEVECMGCFNKVKVADGELKKTGSREKLRHGTSPHVRGPSMSNAGGAAARRNASKPQASFECRSCGVIYCGPCKKAARRRISRERVPPDFDPIV